AWAADEVEDGAVPADVLTVRMNAESAAPRADRAATAGSPGECLGRFQIVAVLGNGAFGTVYQARDPRLDRDVAIKVPREAALRTAEERDRFLREARAAA